MAHLLRLLAVLVLAPPCASDAFLVCYGFYGPVNDLGWTYSQNLARAWVDEETSTASRYVESMSSLKLAQQKEVMDGFINASCDLVVAGSDTLLPLAVEYAVRYPGTKFVVTGTVTNSPNLPNLGAAYIRVYQGRYIAGMLAAMQPGVNSIGYVGSVYAPSSLRDVNAFALGVRAVRPEAQVLLMHVGSWYDPRLEAIAGARLIGLHGVDLLTYDSDSMAIVALAKEAGKYSIAQKADGTSLYGDSNLLSVICTWTTMFADMVQAAQNETLWAIAKDKDRFVGFERGALSLGAFSSRVPASSRILANRMVAKFANATDQVFCGTFESFCPKDANVSESPCANLSRRAPSVGKACLSDDELRNMTWLVKDAVLDLGLLKVPPRCPPGTKLDPTSEATCVTCPVGRFAQGEDEARCELCVAGFYGNVGGASRCQACPAGFFSDPGMSACTACSPGQFGSEPGASECRNCTAGSNSPANGSTSCRLCEEGTYSEAGGASRCEACLAPKTSQRSAASVDQCVCPVGTYTLEDSSCAPCPKGMRCPEGPQPPVLLPRFWSAAVEGSKLVYSVYRCRDEKECPGGPMGSCGANREGIACAYCRPGTTADTDSGGCYDCRGGSVLPIMIICGISMVLAAMLLFYSNMDVARTRRSSADLSVCLGQAVIASPLSSLVGNMTVLWLEPLKTFGKIITVVSFRIEILNVGCIVAERKPSQLFLVKLLIFPAFVVAFSVVFTVSSRCRGVLLDLDRWFDALGVVFVMLYLTLTIVSLLPFRCLESPNGTRSLSDDPGLLCDGGTTYVQMVILGVFGLLLYTVGFFTGVVVATARFPHLVASGRGERMILRYRFLFHRFAANRYFYAPIYLCRNLSLALVPVVFADYAHRQVISFASIMLCSLTLQSWLQPWRAPVPNVVDAALTMCIALSLVVAGILIPSDPVNVRDFLRDLQVFGAFILAMAFACLLGVAGHLVARRYLPKHDFMAFLTHHKLACAAGARLLKIELEQLAAGRVFLDSDHLENLMSLLDIVRCGTKRLIVLLTRETLWRPWCAGEIATAHSNGVPVMAVAYDCYEEPRDEDLEIEGLAGGRKWPIQAFAPLTLQGVTIEAVRVAYLALRGQPKLPMKRVQACLSYDVDQAAETVSELAKFCSGRARSRGPSMLFEERGSRVEAAVVADRMEGEAISTARVLVQMLRIQTQQTVIDLLHVPEELISKAMHGDPAGWIRVSSAAARATGSTDANPTHLLVLLTPGALSSPAFAQCLLGARRAWPQAEVVTCRVPGWQFPSAETFQGVILKQVSRATAMPIEEIAAEYSLLVSKIALPLSPEAHHSVLSAELARIAVRINTLAPSGMQDGVVLTWLPLPSRLSQQAEPGEGVDSRPIVKRDSTLFNVPAHAPDVWEDVGLHIFTTGLDASLQRAGKWFSAPSREGGQCPG